MEACRNNNLLSSFIKGIQDIKMPTFYDNGNIEPVKSQGISGEERIRKDYKKSLVEIRKVANGFAVKQ